MNINENELFGFGKETNEETENVNSFDYSSISGLGESDYENEDVFKSEENSEFSNNNDFSNYAIYNNENNDSLDDKSSTIPLENDYSNNFEMSKIDEVESNYNSDYIDIGNSFDEIEKNQNIELSSDDKIVDNIEEFVSEKPDNYIESFEKYNGDYESLEENNITDSDLNEFENITNIGKENDESKQFEENEKIEESEDIKTPKIEMSGTSIDELNKLTEYKEEKIETTDINSLFDRISVNVQDASEIFRKNTDLKNKIDTRFEELKQLQSEIENSKKKQLDEVNNYKEEVLKKLTEKKEEIEKRLNTLKELQASLEKEKAEFEKYKKAEQDNIDKVQKEVQSAYDDRREELEHIEDVLRKQKDALDEERNQLSLDKIQYEADKNELANNLLKFNEIVNSFTTGVNIEE